MAIARHFKQHFQRRYLNQQPHRSTLAPTIAGPMQGIASAFHRALHLYNYNHNTTAQFDELTKHQQLIVREMAKQIDREDHPCR